MLLLSISSFVYYALQTTGLCIAGVFLLKRILFLKTESNWILVFLTLGLFPAVVSVIGFSGLPRVVPFAEILGAVSALFAAWCLFIARDKLLRKIKSAWRRPHAGAWVMLAASFALLHLIANACMLQGGINNFDQWRGLAFTSGFAANSLKPAHPLDFSIPVSYGYYFYEYTAYLYSSVRGHGWPTVAMLFGSFLGLGFFYLAFLQFVKRIVPKAAPPVMMFAVCALSFYGLDFLSTYTYQGDMWNAYQVTQMAAYWSWLYHYLFAAAFSLAALACLHDALKNRSAAKLFVSLLLIGIAPFYATITGIVFGLVYLCVCLLAIARDRRLLQLLRFGGHAPAAYGLLCGAAALLLLPQLPTFWGREGYLNVAQPVLWFTQAPVLAATAKDWSQNLIVLFFELGPLHAIALLLTPLAIAKLWRRSGHAAMVLAALALVMVVALTFIHAPTYDWYWRGGNFLMIVLAASMVTWLASFVPLKGGFGSKAVWCLLLLLLIPGLLGFGAETGRRIRHGAPAPMEAQVLNAALPLHVAIGETDTASSGVVGFPQGHAFLTGRYLNDGIDPKLFTQQNEIATLAHQAGRAAIAPSNPYWQYFDVYMQPKAFLAEKLNWQGPSGPCARTWFGSALPQQIYAKVDSLAPLKMETQTCPAP